jgi:flagellar assembly protein FliH
MPPRAATKFTFDTEFALKDDIVSGAARARQKKTLTLAEIEALRKEAKAEGTASGQVRAAEAIAAATRDAADALQVVLQRSQATIEEVRAEAARLALAAARALARAALDALPSSEVEAALRESLHQAIGEPRVVLRASPAVAEALEARISDIAHEEGYEGRIMISPDPNISRTDCRIEWRGGGASRSEAALEAAITDLVTRRFNNIDHPLAKE